MEDIEIINAGVPGNNSADIIARLPEVIAWHPDVVVLMVGTNDVLNSFNCVPFPAYEKNLREIITRLREADSRVILMTIPSCLDAYLIQRHGQEFFDTLSPNRKVAKANNIIRHIAAVEKLPLVDLNRIIRNLADIDESKNCILRNVANCGEPDGVHLTPAGYVLTGKAVCGKIRELGWGRGKIVCLGDSITNGVHVRGAGTVSGECYPAQLRVMLSAGNRPPFTDAFSQNQ